LHNITVLLYFDQINTALLRLFFPKNIKRNLTDPKRFHGSVYWARSFLAFNQKLLSQN